MARTYPLILIPAIVASLVTFLLMVIVTLSTPVWDAVYFLKLTVGETTTTFGVLGTTGRGQQVGYIPAEWNPDSTIDPRVDDERLSNITYALLLHPIGAIFSIITLGFSILALGTRRAAVFATCAATLMSLCVLVAFITDMVLFTILKVRFMDSPSDDRSTAYGPAIWITLAAVPVSAIAVGSAAWTMMSKAIYPRRWESETKL